MAGINLVDLRRAELAVRRDMRREVYQVAHQFGMVLVREDEIHREDGTVKDDKHYLTVGSLVVNPTFEQIYERAKKRKL